MKKGVILMMVFTTIALLSSCTTDDKMGGSGPADLTIRATLFAASNTMNSISSFDYTSEGLMIKSNRISSENNEGIFYDKDNDELAVGSASQRVVNIFSNLKNVQDGQDLNLRISSDGILQNPRDLVAKDNIYIVSDNTDLDGDPDTDEGRFFVFERDENGFGLRNTVTVDYAVWGIQLIGNDLYTAVDKTGDVAVLKNFIENYTTDVTASPDKRITIEGINRIHGIAEDRGVVVLTDIGGENNPSDGGFQMINDFVSKFNNTPDGEELELVGNQVRVSGNLTKLGNPVAVDYSYSRQTVYIAERLNGNGKILFFTDVEAGGGLSPSLEVDFKGASSVFFVER